MLTALLVLATSCSGYDDTPIRAAIDSLNDTKPAGDCPDFSSF